MPMYKTKANEIVQAREVRADLAMDLANWTGGDTDGRSVTFVSGGAKHIAFEGDWVIETKGVFNASVDSIFEATHTPIG